MRPHWLTFTQASDNLGRFLLRRNVKIGGYVKFSL
jgi:hypothetical protein